MRLINVKTLNFEEFHHDIPPYAILSHTWGNEEVAFQDYLLVMDPYSNPSTHLRVDAIKKKAGFAKIMGACRRARDDKLGHIWCDTNCIDKTSSTELSEAINSMYTWYHNSAICYAYLADVAVFDTTHRGAEEFRKSRWFTRGWTLQELLAPKEVLFFKRDWKPIATRRHLADIICGVTTIHKDALLNRDMVPIYSIAQRMSWAAGRQTSRQEDIAYCLLGIFDVNMPLLYGEGPKAFIRLQTEIIKASDDQSIFAWDFFGVETLAYSGLLTLSPLNFASCGSIVRDKHVKRWPYSITNLGVSLKLPMIRSVIGNSVLVGLNCSVELHNYRPQEALRTGKMHLPVWIWLTYTGEGNMYKRSSVPESRMSLPVFYPTPRNCIATDLFGVIQFPWVESRKFSTSSGNNNGVYTGFHVVIGFGRLDHETTILKDSFPPRHYVVLRLPPRRLSPLSHEIITAGNYAVLLSIVWDQQQQRPLHWDFDILTGGLGSVGRWSMNDWDILFRAQPRSGLRQSDPAGQIKYIYNQLRKDVFYQPMSDIDKNLAPMVYFGKDIMQDQHSRPKVVAHLTFQELGRRESVVYETDSD